MNKMQFTIMKKNYKTNINGETTIVQPLSNNVSHVNILRPSTNNVSNEKGNERKMKWGQPIWFLFHTLAEKVKVDDFPYIKKELFNNIVLICKNLPCPTCASHATDFMSKVNFNVINTKEELKTLLFQFHNVVNHKKGFPIFTRVELDEKYSKAVTMNIINNFLIHFQNKHRSIQMIADDMYRQRLSLLLKDWFITNINKFAN